MDLKHVLNVKTKLNKGAQEHITVLTFDYTGVTAAELQGPAEDSLVILWQGRKRRAKLIPKQEVVKVKEMIAGMGSRSVPPVTVEGVVAASETFTKEQRDQIIAQLRALDLQKKAA